MADQQIRFGTDGWRGVISDNFTFKNVARVAQAIADFYSRGQGIKIAVGFDTRFLSEKYAAIVSRVLADNGIAVQLSDRAIPTPALSFAVNRGGMTAGVMITASHNPSEYNGIKIKTASGGAAGTDVTKEVENLIDNPPEKKPSQAAEIIKVDMTKGYVKFLRSYIDIKKLKSARFKVLVDVMHGSGNGFIAEVLKGSKIKLELLRHDVNPSFEGLRPEPVIENLGPTLKRLKEQKFDVALVLDGDADRIAAFSGDGEYIYPQKVLGLLALHLVEDRKMSGGLVKTIVGSNIMDNLAKEFKRELFETPVGFKYISELMLTKDILVGGEEAGGMGFKNYIPERDGSLAGLLLLEMMVDRKKPMLKIMQEMEKKYGRFYYLREDTKLSEGFKLDENKLRAIKELDGKKVVEIKDYDGIKLVCEDGSWLMFRASGTEPLMRVYAESKSLAKTKRLLSQGKGLLG